METSHERTTTTKTYNVTHTVPPHSLVITRTGSTALGGSKQGGSTVTRTVKTGGGGKGPDVSFTEGQFAMVTATGVNAVKDARDKERQDMQDLNDRFANYIEKATSISVCLSVCLSLSLSLSLCVSVFLSLHLYFLLVTVVRFTTREKL